MNFPNFFSKVLITLFLSYSAVYTIGQIPPGYYDPAAGKTGTALQAALHNIIKDHTVVSYSSIPGFFPSTDAKPGSVVWDMYSDVPGGTPPYTYHYGAGQECGNYSGEGDCYNREHSWPKSWFNDLSPMYSDLFHIYPTDGYVNGMRSNYPYGTVGSTSWTSQNGCKLGNSNWPGYSGTVFEPLNEYKGDFARTYFYMETRYYTEDAGWAVTDMTNKSQLKSWAQTMMMHWSNIDPVSTKETNRNNAVYAIQNNRNPFIDHPEYAALIWGNPVGTDEMSENHILAVYPNPATDNCSVLFPVNKLDANPVIRIFDLNGNEIKTEYIFEGNECRMDIQKLTPGFFSLLFSLNNQTFRARLIKL